jgi:hypothetical protein
VITYEEQVRVMREARDQAIQQRAATDGLTIAEAELAIEMDATNAALDERVAASRSVAEAEFGMQDAVKAANDALDDGVKKGRAAKDILFGLSGAAVDLASAEEAASGSAEDYNAVISKQRDRFIETATQMGYNQTQAERLADKYGLIPKRVETSISTPGLTDAQTRADALNRTLTLIDGRVVSAAVDVKRYGQTALAAGGAIAASKAARAASTFSLHTIGS